MPMLIYSGLSINIFSLVFIILMTRRMKTTYPDCNSNPGVEDCWDDNMRNEKAFFAMPLLGIGEITMGPVVGWVRDKTSNKVAITL